MLTLEVEGFGADAEGLCKHQGLVVFVPGALPGESIEALIVKVARNHAFGKLQRVLKSSPARVTPPCPYYPRCGGCSCQHMDYAQELLFKQSVVADALQRIGGIDISVPPVLGMAEPWRYRNKATMPVTLVDDKPVSGFYMRRSHRVIPVDECLIAKPGSDLAAQLVCDWMAAHEVPAYDEQRHSGLIRHIMTRVSADDQVMVTLVTNGEDIPHKDELIESLKAGLPGFCSLSLSPNKQPGNTIMGTDYRVLYGQQRLRDRLCGFDFLLSPLSFFQVNHAQAERLYTCALEMADLRPDDLVIDLYCGAGTISSLFASQAREVIGIEIVPQAVQDAIENAKLNDLRNLRFLQGAAEELMPRLYREGSRPDIVVLDPPRKGAEQAVLEAIALAAPRRVVYISCHPGTQARDARWLCEHGYRVSACKSVDMFCQTAEIENILCFDREVSA